MTISREERYVNLAMINLGEAITEIHNVRQRGNLGTIEGKDFGQVFGAAQIAIERAIRALRGETYIPPPDKKG